MQYRHLILLMYERCKDHGEQYARIFPYPKGQVHFTNTTDIQRGRRRESEVKESTRE